MNPHFIFNSLIAIESFIYKNEPREAGKYLSGFAKLMRLILENSREEYIALDKEIKTLQYYLELQKLRFEEKFVYSIEVEEGLDAENMVIPPMLAQPFIENSIEHGLKNINAMGEIRIRFSKKENDLIFELVDNGIGLERSVTIDREEKKHKSMATIITNERLAILNTKKKDKIKIFIGEIRDSYDKVLGTKVSFSIPAKEL
jgi:LytS/YehU family sensor histidine kinase